MSFSFKNPLPGAVELYRFNLLEDFKDILKSVNLYITTLQALRVVYIRILNVHFFLVQVKLLSYLSLSFPAWFHCICNSPQEWSTAIRPRWQRTKYIYIQGKNSSRMREIRWGEQCIFPYSSISGYFVLQSNCWMFLISIVTSAFAPGYYFAV